MTIKRPTQIMLISMLLASLLLLSGCYSGAQKKKTHKGVGGVQVATDVDGFPDDVPVDIHNIPNAKPKHEPLSKYGNPASYTQFGRQYKILHSAKGYSEKGKASWYGKKFHGRRTSSGESYNMFGMTAAHKTLPIPSYVKVTNLDNGKEVVLKVNDRGPFHVDRIIDLSYTAAAKLGILGKGTGRVHVASITPGHHHEIVAKEKLKQKHLNDSKENVQVAQNKTKAPKPTPQPTDKAEKTQSAEKIASKSADASSQIYLQLGAFSNKKSAQTMVEKAKALSLGEEVQIYATDRKHSPLYRVRIGPIANESKATDLQKSLIAQQYSAQRVLLD